MNRRLVPVILAALAVAVAAWLLLRGGERAGEGALREIPAERGGGESGAAPRAVPAPRRVARPVGTGAASDASSFTGAGLRVLVLDASTRTPVPSAVAGLHVEDGGHWSAHAREDGTARFDGLPGGVGNVSLHAGGFIDGRASVALVDGVEVEVEVLLQPVPRITGRVISASTGKPVAGAEVRATDRVISSDWLQAPPAAVTGADGGFTASAGGDGREVRIHASAKGYLPTEVTHRHTAPGVEANRPTISLQPSGRIRGTVRDERGRPVVGAFVSVRPAGPIRAGGVIWTTLRHESDSGTHTGGDGTFEVGDLAAGGLYLVQGKNSSPISWGTEERVLVPEAGGEGRVDLVLDRGGRLLLTWNLPEGVVEEPPTILVTGTAGNAGFFRVHRFRSGHTITGWDMGGVDLRESGDQTEAGEWVVDVPPGTFTVSVTVGRAQGKGTVTVGPGETVEWKVDLVKTEDRETIIEGTVVNDLGEPATRVPVQITPLGTGAEEGGFQDLMGRDGSRLSVTDAEGRFLFPHLQPGRNYLVSAANGTISVETTAPRSGLALGVTRDATIEGNAVIPAGLAADGLLEFRTGIPDGQDGWKPWIGDTVGWSGGRFAAPWIPPGPVRLWLRRGGLVGGPVEITVAPGEKKDLGGIPMRAGVPFTGKVVDTTGRPVAGALMALGNSTRLAYAVSGSPVTGADGSFDLGTRPPVPWPLAIEGESCVRTVLTVDPAAPAPLRFVVPRGGILKGRAKDGDGLPAAGAAVEAAPAGGGPASRLTVDHLGRFEARLPAEVYQLTIHFAGVTVPAGTARLEEGGPADLALTAR